MKETRRLLDNWLPPENAGRALGCLATTFTFDPDFFEGECLARFLGLDGKRGEGSDLAFMIDKEERLAEARVTVIVDRSYNAETRSLRWDILPARLRRGLQHSKVSLLVWERLVRFVIGSANLTPAGYRRQVEAATVLDAFPESETPKSLIDDAISGLEWIVSFAHEDLREKGPRRRALETLGVARERTAAFSLPEGFPGRLSAAIIRSGPENPALPQLDKIWRGGPARYAEVVSPFFDTAEDTSAAAEALISRVAARGSCEFAFVVQTENRDQKTIVRAPGSIQRVLSRRKSAAVEFRALKCPEGEDLRRLHAKSILLQSDQWIAVMIGSSNFTAAGLGVGPSANHLELNLAYGAPTDSPQGKDLWRFLKGWVGEAIDLNNAEFEPLMDEESVGPAVLPWGFVQAVLELDPSRKLIVRLIPNDLPPTWRLELAGAGRLTDESSWAAAGRPERLLFDLPPDAEPFLIDVHWTDEEGATLHVGWPVNVTDMAALASPKALRDLPIDAILEALASTRPLHEAIVAILERSEKARQRGLEPELDPLKRFAGSGRLLRRARQLSLALAGLRRRMERPAANLDAAVWRLRGPFGPKAIAVGLLRESGNGDFVTGEADFALAELALTIARVQWNPEAIRDRVLPVAREVIEELRSLRSVNLPDRRLTEYVDRAFREAVR